MKFLTLSLLFLCSIATQAMHVIPSQSKENLRLLHNGTKTYIEDENASYQVERYDMNHLMKKLIDRDILAKFAARDGYVRIAKHAEGKYTLMAKVRGDGGGWLTGQIAAFTVRAVGYGSFGIACFFHPAYIVEAHIVHEAVEATALTAQIAGEVLPTP